MPWPWSSSKKEESGSHSVSPEKVSRAAYSSEQQQGGWSVERGKDAHSEVKFDPSIKEDQVKALMYKIDGIKERKEGSLFDFQLSAPVGNGRVAMVGARVFLPRQFPVERPVVQLMAPVSHPWVNQYMQADGHPGLVDWKASSPSLLADILLEIMTEFNRTATSLQSPGYGGQQVMGEDGNGGVKILSPAWGAGTGDPHGRNLSSTSTNSQLSGGYHASIGYQPYLRSPLDGQQVARPAPFENLIRAQSEGELSHTPIPPVPSEFPELKDKPLSQLNRLVDDDVARMALMKAMPSVVSFSDMKDQLCYGNVQTATENLEKQKELENLQTTVVKLTETLQNEVGEHAALARQMYQFDGFGNTARGGSNQALLKSIMYMSKEWDEKSESMAEALLEFKPTMDTQTFLVDYLELRRRYHTLAAKAEGLKRSMNMV